MNFLTDKRASGLQTDFQWAKNTLRSNVPELPADFEHWPGKYALDCDAPGLGAWLPAPGYDGAAELAQVQAERIQAVKDAGRARVDVAGYDDQTQRRLLFKNSTDTERKACGALIEAVKAAVDAAKTAIQAAADEAAIDAERDSAISAIGAIQ